MKLWAVVYYGGSEPDSTVLCGVFASKDAATAYIEAWGGDWHDSLEEHKLVETVDSAIKLQKKAAKAGPSPLWARRR